MKRYAYIAAAVVLGVLLVLALRPSPLPVSAVEASSGPFQHFVEEEGRTRLRDTYNVSAPISGFLQRVALEVGDPVEAGQVVFRMEPQPVPALDARAREQAQESIAAARARLRAASADLETRGAEAAFARSEFERHERLFAEGVVSATLMDRTRAERDRSMAAERAAGAAVDVAALRSGECPCDGGDWRGPQGSVGPTGTRGDRARERGRAAPPSLLRGGGQRR